ncbi:hypothetical protein HDU67_001149 [Dinochytrium kinnereticum]|nr:hypothetical protein HDU67_001149 [Dinochytrium kinnereticum]
MHCYSTLTRLLAAVLVLSSASTPGSAAPAISLKRQIALPAFFSPPTVVETSPVPISKGVDASDAARLYILSKLRLADGNPAQEESVQVQSTKSSRLGQHIYLQETHRGIPIVNAVSNVNLDKEGNVILASHLETSGSALARRSVDPIPTEPTVSPVDALIAFIREADIIDDNQPIPAGLRVADDAKSILGAVEAGLTISDVTVDKKYYMTPEKTLELVWDMVVERDDSWLNALVSATSGKVFAVNNWVYDAQVDLSPRAEDEVEQPKIEEADAVEYYDEEVDNVFVVDEDVDVLVPVVEEVGVVDDVQVSGFSRKQQQQQRPSPQQVNRLQGISDWFKRIFGIEIVFEIPGYPPSKPKPTRTSSAVKTVTTVTKTSRTKTTRTRTTKTSTRRTRTRTKTATFTSVFVPSTTFTSTIATTSVETSAVSVPTTTASTLTFIVPSGPTSAETTTTEPPATFTVVIPTSTTTTTTIGQGPITPTTTTVAPKPTTTTTTTTVAPKPTTTTTTTTVAPKPTTTTTTTAPKPTTTTTTTTTVPPKPTATSNPQPPPGNSDAPAHFLALPYNRESPLDQPGIIMIDNAVPDSEASPKGWIGNVNNAQTSGNNLVVMDSNKRTAGATEVKDVNGKKVNVFEHRFDTRRSATDSVQAAAVNVFYLSNEYHDIMYQFGFDEQSGNFQNDNFGRGGRGNDGIIATVQDASGKNNAFFSTGPDGLAGKMSMFLFSNRNSERDGDFDHTVVIHELTHGLSIRLTGSKFNQNCLQTTEAGGMGEGWADTFAYIITAQPTHTRDTDRVIGGYATGNTRSGIRSQPYSTSLSRNTFMYSSIQGLTAVHRIGEIWASILFEVYWNMVDASGFFENLRDPKAPSSGKGNTDMIQLLIDAFKLQECNPTFVTARDAILAADKQEFGGKYRCAIWRGFAKRGLGVNARNMRDDRSIPADC